LTERKRGDGAPTRGLRKEQEQEGRVKQKKSKEKKKIPFDKKKKCFWRRALPLTSSTSRTPFLVSLPYTPFFLSFLFLWSHQRLRIWRTSADVMRCDELIHA
jgi:hypothetical protein